MKRALVTGSSGLIGSEAVIFLDRLGWAVHGVDNNMRRSFFGPDGDTTWNLKRLQRDTHHFTHHEMDIRDQDAIVHLFKRERPDLIIHCAAQPSHDLAARRPVDDFSINALGTMYLLEAARQQCPETPFIFMSTNKVYGDAPNEKPLVELGTRWEYRDPADHDYHFFLFYLFHSTYFFLFYSSFIQLCLTLTNIHRIPLIFFSILPAPPRVLNPRPAYLDTTLPHAQFRYHTSPYTYYPRTSLYHHRASLSPQRLSSHTFALFSYPDHPSPHPRPGRTDGPTARGAPLAAVLSHLYYTQKLSATSPTARPLISSRLQSVPHTSPTLILCTLHFQNRNIVAA